MKQQIQQFSELVGQCMLSDRGRLQRQLRALQQGGDTSARESILDDLEKQVHASRQRVQQRQQQIPAITYPEELPVSARREEIAKAVRDHQVVIVAGETGSGKTTQLPKICLELGRGRYGMIGHTQPRRIAARSVADRIASELKTETGTVVGYRVRFHDHMAEHASVKLMTDGILLAEIQTDRNLWQYDTLIIDEAHERSLNIDFLLGYLKQLLPRRPDLKIIITSATIDTARFARHFSDAPVIEVSGRTYPVEIRYRPLDMEESDGSMLAGILAAVDELSAIDAGDVLVFLSGEREIRETAEALRKHHPPATEILPLYARLSVAEQNRVFQPHGRRRIVLATNVAETSLTVPGIRYVVDTGLARVSRYSVRSRVQRLPIEKISQASANQRSGRCGRVSAGVCIRLYDEQDFSGRPAFTDPEILRTNLAAVILQMTALGLGDVEQFPFVDPPERKHINDGYRLLLELGAVNSQRMLSKQGRQLARLPVDPRVGSMIQQAAVNGCLPEVLVIASALCVQDPRERPAEKQQQADEAHAIWRDKRSDFMSFYNLWVFFHQQRKKLSQSRLRKLCKQRFLAYRRMLEWHDIHQQLLKSVRDMKLARTDLALDDERINDGYLDNIHRSLLAGLLSNIGFRDEDREYSGGHGKRFFPFPGTGVSKLPKWVMAAELVETSRLFARTLAPIKPEWVEALAQHIVRRSYSEPHWQKRAGQVGAWEKVSLYGLVIVPRRRVNYGPIDPRVSREIFIREALVEGQFETGAAFFGHNRDLLQSVQLLEHKSRRRDIVIDEEDLFQFYDAIVPADIYNAKSFDKWRKQVEQEDSETLFLDRDKLVRDDAPVVVDNDYPDYLQAGSLSLPLSYRFEPGHEADGVTVTVPLSQLNQLDNGMLEWLVPGLLPDLVEQLLRSLPKSVRSSLVPVQETALACVGQLQPGSAPLLVQLADIIAASGRRRVGNNEWNLQKLPDHLRMRICVTGEQGNVLGCSRDLGDLQAEYTEQASVSFSRAGGSAYERDSLESWDFGNLPDVVEIETETGTVQGYPGLQAEGESVALRVFDTPLAASRAHQHGVCQLFRLQRKKDISYLHKHLPHIKQLCLTYASFGDCEELKQALLDRVVELAMPAAGNIRSDSQFEQAVLDAAGQLMQQANRLCDALSQAFALRKDVVVAMHEGVLPVEAIEDMETQLEYLYYPGFIGEVPATVIAHYPRYMKAMLRRLERLHSNPGRDAQLQQQLQPFWQDYLQASQQVLEAGEWSGALEDFHWLLEEMRVSLFAQELKTAQPVSIKKLQQAWRELEL